MHRKCFSQPELHRLAAESAPPSRTQAQLLCDSVVCYAVIHLFASRVHLVRFLRFSDFINGVEYPSSDVIAPLCLFALHDGMWWPAAVVACVPDGSPGRAGGKTQHFLQSIGISYVVVTPPQVADGYARTTACVTPPITRNADSSSQPSGWRQRCTPSTGGNSVAS